ncbi:MAG TPA: glucose-1-phosphate adenylyltransferase [Solimonas sp.]|nr:glucose-1-phosphate adenylyltransferase [Solimonas sp.]
MDHQGDPRFVSRLTRETLALVMAGGRGSRLMGLTSWRAKPAVPFAGKFRIIDFTLSNCINSGIRRIGVLTQYKSHALIRHLQMGWGFMRGEVGEFVEILPAQQRIDETSWYAGTADAVYQNLDIIRGHQPALVLILAGDHIYKMDYGGMLAHHAATGARITVGCIEVPVAEARGFGVMLTDEDTRVLRFDEKPQQPEPMPGRPDTALASMGIYVFDAGFLLDFLTHDAGLAGSSHDFGRDVIPAAIAGGKVYAYPFRDLKNNRQGYWRDVGTVDAYWSANVELTAVVPELNLYDLDWPICTYQTQSPPAKFVFDQPGQRGAAVDSMVSGGCIVSGAQVRRSVLFSNVRIDSGSLIEDSVVLPGATVGRGCRIKRAVIDENCIIAEGSVIGEDREIDAQRYYVSAGGVTLVTPEMLGQPHLVR